LAFVGLDSMFASLFVSISDAGCGDEL